MRIRAQYTSLMTPHPRSEGKRRDVSALGGLSGHGIQRNRTQTSQDTLGNAVGLADKIVGNYWVQQVGAGTVAIPNRSDPIASACALLRGKSNARNHAVEAFHPHDVKELNLSIIAEETRRSSQSEVGSKPFIPIGELEANASAQREPQDPMSRSSDLSTVVRPEPVEGRTKVERA